MKRLKYLLVCVVGLPILFGTVLAQDSKDKKSDKEKLQGDWELFSREVRGKVIEKSKFHIELVVEGDTWYLGSIDGGVMKRTVRLDPSKTPKTIDLTLKLKDENLVYLGIYKLEGDTLTICFFDGKVNAKDRPKEFKTKEGAGNMQVWKRAKNTKP